MDIKKIRIANINYLADKHGRERLAECDTRKKWTTNYINQLCGGFGSFGASTARRIETGLGINFGWMDLMHAEVPYQNSNAPQGEDVSKAQIISLWEKMSPEERVQLVRIGHALVEK